MLVCHCRCQPPCKPVQACVFTLFSPVFSHPSLQVLLTLISKYVGAVDKEGQIQSESDAQVALVCLEISAELVVILGNACASVCFQKMTTVAHLPLFWKKRRLNNAHVSIISPGVRMAHRCLTPCCPSYWRRPSIPPLMCGLLPPCA